MPSPSTTLASLEKAILRMASHIHFATTIPPTLSFSSPSSAHRERRWCIPASFQPYPQIHRMCTRARSISNDACTVYGDPPPSHPLIRRIGSQWVMEMGIYFDDANPWRTSERSIRLIVFRRACHYQRRVGVTPRAYASLLEPLGYPYLRS